MKDSSWYAIEQISGSIKDVKELLLPPDSGTWLRMALIVLLTGGLFSGFPPIGSGDFSDSDFENSTVEDFNDAPEELSSEASAAIIAGITGAVFIAGFVSAVFRLIFFRTVMEGKPRIRRYGRKHWKDGLKLISIKLLTTGIFIVSILGVAAAFIGQGITTGTVSLLVMLPIWIGIYLFSFTLNNYAVPDIVKNGSGMIGAIKLGLSIFRDEWKQAGIFLLVKVGTGIAVSAAMGTIGIILLITLGIPFGLVIAASFAFSGTAGVLALIAGLLLFLCGSVLLAVPFRTYVTQWVFNSFEQFEA